MGHPDTPQWLALIRGALAPEETLALRAHLSVCGDCVAALAQLQAVDRDAPTVDHGGARGPTAPAPTPPATTIDRYVVVGALGQGGMGAVYAAYDPTLDRRVALKLLLGDGGPDAVQRLEREARALARVTHPNAVAVYDAGRHEGQVFIAMEHVAGETLRDWLRTPRAWPEVVRVMRRAARGLQAVHDAGLVHRDFKPSNVIVTTDGRAKVLDFGLVRVSQHQVAEDDDTEPLPPGEAGGPSPAPLTRLGGVVGTPGYLAPELFQRQPASAASDQFAFGVTLFQALFRRRPFEGSTERALQLALKTPPTLSAAEQALVPPWLWAIVQRCLSIDPAARFASMNDVIAALQREPLRRRQRWARAAVALFAVMAAVALGRWWGASRCEREAALEARVWPAEARSALQKRLLGVAPDAARVERALVAIDGTVQAWARQSVSTCRALEAHDSVLEAQRAGCLERQEQAIGTLLAALGDVDSAVLLHGDDLVASTLEGLRCDDDSQLSRVQLERPAQDPERASRIRKLLLSSRAYALLEQNDRALTAARQAVALAADAGLPGAEGEGWYWVASTEAWRGEAEAATRDFQRAWELALRAGNDEAAVLAGARLVGWLTDRTERVSEARTVAEACTAIWVRLGRPARLEIALLEAESWLANAEGDLQRRFELRARRAQLLETLHGPASRETALAHLRVSEAAWDLGDVHRSTALALQSSALLTALDADSLVALSTEPVVLGSLNDLCRSEGVIARGTPGLERAQRVLDAADRTQSDLMVELAIAWLGRDDARSRALFEAALARHALADDALAHSMVWRNYARVLVRLGEPARALEACQRSAALAAPFLDPTHRNARELAVCEGEALLAIDPVSAHAALARAMTWDSSLRQPLPRALTYRLYAEALHRTGQDPRRARALALVAQATLRSLPSCTRELALVDALLERLP